MKGLFLISALSACFVLVSVQAETIKPLVRVASFRGDRPAAITYTFDDGLRDQMTLALPMLEESGFHATFFVIPGKVAETPEAGAAMKPGEWGGISWPELAEISRKGHEIGNHSWRHENLTKLEDARLVEEVEKGRSEIASKLGKAPLTFCYPYNAVDERVRKAVLKNHIGAREFQSAMAKDATGETLNAWADGMVKNKKWGVAMIHGIAAGFDAFADPEVLRKHFQYVKQQENGIWVDTFSNVLRYIMERESIELKVAQKPGQISCVMGSPLDPKIFNSPLTLVIEVEGVSVAEALRAGIRLPLKVESGKILVEVVPGSEPVVINWQ